MVPVRPIQSMGRSELAQARRRESPSAAGFSPARNRPACLWGKAGPSGEKRGAAQRGALAALRLSRHVWTAPVGQWVLAASATGLERSCIRPLSAALLTAGHDGVSRVGLPSIAARFGRERDDEAECRPFDCAALKA